MSDWIQTYTGRRFFWKDPHPEQVSILDIAHALSNECRFGGHCIEHYSVAQHSVHVSELVPLEYGLVGLLHDAAEAYCKDIPRPIKREMEDFKRVEARILAVLSEVFRVDLVNLPAAVKRADMQMLATERRDLMRPIDWPGFNYEPLPRKVRAVLPVEAKRQFLALFRFHSGADVEAEWGVAV